MAYVYELGSQTDYFAGFQPVDQFLEAVEVGPNLDPPSVALEKANAWLTRCRELLRRHTSWEGDVRQDGQLRCEGVGALPAFDRSHPYLVYIVKQDHQGRTYAVSEVPLPGAPDVPFRDPQGR